MDTRLTITQRKVNFLAQNIDELLLDPDLLSVILEELAMILEEFQVQQETLLQNQENELKKYQYYQALFHSAPEAYLITNPQGIIQHINYQASLMFKESPLRLVNKPLIIFIPRSHHQSFYQMLDKMTLTYSQTYQSYFPTIQDELEIPIQSKKLAPFPVKMKITTLHDEQHQLQGLRWLIVA